MVSQYNNNNYTNLCVQTATVQYKRNIKSYKYIQIINNNVSSTLMLHTVHLHFRF